MTPPLDLAAIRERTDEAAAALRAMARVSIGEQVVAVAATDEALTRFDLAAHASATDVPALCDALDAARATIAAQAAEVERLWHDLSTTAAAVEAALTAELHTADARDVAERIAADALRLGLEECERLREEVDRFRGITEARGRSIARMAEERDALRAEVARLRAVVEGRTTPPTETKGDDDR